VRAGYLLDTDWIIDHLNGVAAVAARLKELQPAGLAVSIISLADRSALAQKGFDLLEHKGVALDGGRVVGLLVPDVAPDVLSLERRWETAQPGFELCHSLCQLPVNCLATRATSC
jgi:hypothetical protein